MDMVYIIAKWLLERLKSENLISESVSDNVMERFLQNFSGGTENLETEDEAA